VVGDLYLESELGDLLGDVTGGTDFVVLLGIVTRADEHGVETEEKNICTAVLHGVTNAGFKKFKRFIPILLSTF
jgi:hypothetical protein